jgi:hypothetical protein
MQLVQKMKCTIIVQLMDANNSLTAKEDLKEL